MTLPSEGSVAAEDEFRLFFEEQIVNKRVIATVESSGHKMLVTMFETNPLSIESRLLD